MAEPDLSSFNLREEVRSNAKWSMGCMGTLAMGGAMLIIPNCGDLLKIIDRGNWSVLVGGLALAGLTLLFGFMALSGYREMQDPGLHAIYAKLAKLGPVDKVVADLEKEIRESGHSIGSFIFTPSYLFDKTKLDVHQYRDLLWIYKKQTKHSVNFIPTGTTYEVIMHLRDGSQHNMSGAAEVVDKVLLILANGCPWVVAGYSAELAELWNRSPQQFAAAVDARGQRP